MSVDGVLNQVHIIYIGATIAVEKIHYADKPFDNIIFLTICLIKIALYKQALWLNNYTSKE